MYKRIDLSKFKILSGSMLKIIAVIAMLIDHTGLIIFSQMSFMQQPLLTIGSMVITGYFIARKIGRLAFPIFCYLITEGFLHTKNKIRYGASLLIFALLSEIPFDLMISGRIFYLGKQNIYFTLFLGFLCMYILEKCKKQTYLFAVLFIVLLGARILNVDYGVAGVVLILLLFAMKNCPALGTILAYPLLSGGLAAFAAFVPINMYNGKRGFIKAPALKYCFYLFYPLHIIILLLIERIAF